ncbi:MAG: hypothetical protein GXY55_05620 [Phycisphaerae bacterium]|nr:hypothetical protein [Phycisphaerae bacterium]
MGDILRDALNACSFQSGLEADDPWRVDLHALGVRGRDFDPMIRLQTVIQTADKPTQQLFSGFIGSGKSTELKRLAANLRNDDYTVVFVDSEDYLNLNVPPRVNDLLATVAAGVDKFIQEDCRNGIAGPFKSYWERFRGLIGSGIEVEGLAISVPAVGELGLKLKQDVTLKARIYSYLERSGRLSDLAQACHDFLGEVIPVIANARPDHKGLVVIIDTFEKVRPTDLRQTEEVRQAVETIFIRDWKWLQLPCHVVYTVPSWLTFYEFGTGVDRVCILPMCRLMDRKTGKPVPAGFAAMREIIEKRMPMDQVFSDAGTLDTLIEASGGYPRDLLRMMREVLLSAAMKKISPPIPPDILTQLVEEVIRDQVRVYDKPIYDDDLPLLVEVARARDVPRATRTQAFRLAELFDHHFVLGYRNGEEWYDLHPLVRRSPKVQAALKQAHGKKAKQQE